MTKTAARFQTRNAPALKKAFRELALPRRKQISIAGPSFLQVHSLLSQLEGEVRAYAHERRVPGASGFLFDWHADKICDFWPKFMRSAESALPDPILRKRTLTEWTEALAALPKSDNLFKKPQIYTVPKTVVPEELQEQYYKWSFLLADFLFAFGKFAETDAALAWGVPWKRGLTTAVHQHALRQGAHVLRAVLSKPGLSAESMSEKADRVIRERFAPSFKYKGGKIYAEFRRDREKIRGLALDGGEMVNYLLAGDPGRYHDIFEPNAPKIVLPESFFPRQGLEVEISMGPDCGSLRDCQEKLGQVPALSALDMEDTVTREEGLISEAGYFGVEVKAPILHSRTQARDFVEAVFDESSPVKYRNTTMAATHVHVNLLDTYAATAPYGADWMESLKRFESRTAFYEKNVSEALFPVERQADNNVYAAESLTPFNVGDDRMASFFLYHACIRQARSIRELYNVTQSERKYFTHNLASFFNFGTEEWREPPALSSAPAILKIMELEETAVKGAFTGAPVLKEEIPELVRQTAEEIQKRPEEIQPSPYKSVYPSMSFETEDISVAQVDTHTNGCDLIISGAEAAFMKEKTALFNQQNSR